MYGTDNDVVKTYLFSQILEKKYVLKNLRRTERDVTMEVFLSVLIFLWRRISDKAVNNLPNPKGLSVKYSTVGKLI